MLDFKRARDPITQEPVIESSVTGKFLLTTPQLNKGTAFSNEERRSFGLLGKLPHRVESLEEQVERAYAQYLSYSNSALQKNIYLNNLHDKNQVLFYKLLSTHLAEMLPIIYTPIVGTAVKQFSREYRQPRGLYIAHTDQQDLEAIISNRSNPEIDVIVVTDGEGVLGIGDQGIGGMDIPVAKLMVYSVCGGLDPTRTLPVFLDVGTNNQALLDDPFYLGCPHPRIPREDYDAFIERFVSTIRRHFPQAFLHWEDLGRSNARRILDQYSDKLCTFNDDIQGTGTVTLAALLSACDVTGTPLTEQRILMFGAGTAGTGICDQLFDAMIRLGLTEQQARQHFWLVDRQGLLVDGDPILTSAQILYARDRQEFSEASPPPRNLEDSVAAIQPTVLIGCSAQAGAFHQGIIRRMVGYCERPIVFPLSNPDELCEAKPADLRLWTKGKALVATGTAFDLVTTQCNNALIFPGIGMGVTAVRARRLSKAMLWAATQALSQASPSRHNPDLPLLPSLDQAKELSKTIALAVAQSAIDTGLAEWVPDKALEDQIEEVFWEPRYLRFVKVPNA